MKNDLLWIEEIKIATRVLRAVNHKVRRDILALLDKKNRTVTEIYLSLQMQPSACSSHLMILRKEGIIEAKRDGKNKIYCLNDYRLQEINNYAKRLAEGKS